jgi:predicted acylesterase/phospholipase RssA
MAPSTPLPPLTKASPSIIFQSAKLGNMELIAKELDWAQSLLDKEETPSRVYGVSGGALPALAFSLSLAARYDPKNWGKAADIIPTFSAFLRKAPSAKIRSLNHDPRWGIYNLNPLRRWIEMRLNEVGHSKDTLISALPLRLYLCVMDIDGTFTLFGKPDDSLQIDYQFAHVGPPQDAPIPDALIAALSTLLSISPARVNGAWYRDCRPAFSDAGAIIADLESSNSHPIHRHTPYTPIRTWQLNTITSSFIMHTQNERNQHLLASYYLDLLDRQCLLESITRNFPPPQPPLQCRNAYHINLPYVGSTEAFTNMRQCVQHKTELIDKFRDLLAGQLDQIYFDQPTNIIYGAGGFSGILAGLVTTRAIHEQLKLHGGEVRQVYGVSAGVLNGFFHAVQLAAALHPDLYRPAAQLALSDLEKYIATISRKKIGRYNLNPVRFWQGVANLGPLEEFLKDRLAAYTGSQHPGQILFDDIALPLTVTAARGDGFTDFMGMTQPPRKMHFAGRQIAVQPAPVVKAILAGWSMNTYIQPAALNGQFYRDGGGTFYDIGLFVACLDAELTNLINIHLDEPEGHSYHLPPRPNLLRILFDTHNYYFPEERRRMYYLTNLLYEYFRLRALYIANSDGSPSAIPLQTDFRQNWQVAL